MLGHAAAALERIRNFCRLLGIRRNVERTCCSPQELAALWAGEAAFIVQKSMVEYCRARAGCSWTRLFEASDLAVAMTRARWTAYPAALGDVAEMTQILLRRSGSERAAGPDSLGSVVRRALRHHGAPEIPLDLEAAETTILDRLDRALQKPPRPVRLFGAATGHAIFEVLPLKTDNRGDREVLQNQVGFLLCGVYARLEETIEVAALARALEPAPR